MNPKKNKRPSLARRQYFIKKEFQARFIIKFVLILIAGGLVSIGMTFLNNHDTLTTTYTNSKLVIQNTSLAIMPSVVFTTILTTVLLGIVVIALTLLFSHKIAGPMFRFEKDIKRIADGDLKSRINIRKGDQFQELALGLNDMIQSLSDRVGRIKKETDSDRLTKTIDENFKL